MNKTWYFRPVEVKDCAKVAMHRYFDLRATDEDRATYCEWLIGSILGKKYVGLLLEEDNRIIAGAGMVMLDWGPTRGSPCSIRGRIVNVYCEPAARRQGIAKSLVGALLEVGKELGIVTFVLASTTDSTGLYGALGFREYPTEMILTL